MHVDPGRLGCLSLPILNLPSLKQLRSLYRWYVFPSVIQSDFSLIFRSPSAFYGLGSVFILNNGYQFVAQFALQAQHGHLRRTRHTQSARPPICCLLSTPSHDLTVSFDNGQCANSGNRRRYRRKSLLSAPSGANGVPAVNRSSPLLMLSFPENLTRPSTGRTR